ncbi:curamycin polyketide synthase [Streptomyces sp. Ru71]|uniref:acyl carrier protein n=1 Tax=Streptomyces sp. Ru71 TaxID=2080746 RepID=UPI000CDDB800|nr:acyl carrier protein [Streptomyces sp. Ru71]POX56749.1 curamycin polyketide synthase [Streptomyces sp. Ru71]
MTDQLDHQVASRVTYSELSDLMKRTAGVVVDPQELEQRSASGFDSFGLDSLGLLGIVAELEKRHAVGLPENAEKCKTPAEFLALVNDALTKGA